MRTTEGRAAVQLRNILFATNFSPGAAAALRYAVAIAKRYDARLCLLEVRPGVNWALTPPGPWQGMEEAARIEDERERQNIVASLPEVRPEVFVKRGDLWSNLAAVIEANEIDLIVIGTSGHSGMAQLFLGSSAEEIFRKASCPVLIIGPHSPAEPSMEIKTILFATDLRPQSTAAPYAISLAEEYGARLILLHVVEHQESLDYSLFVTLLRNLVPSEAEFWCSPEYLVERGSAAEKILDVATNRQPDLLIMGARQLRGFPGAATHLPITTAHKVVSRAPCPVLTLCG